LGYLSQHQRITITQALLDIIDMALDMQIMPVLCSAVWAEDELMITYLLLIPLMMQSK